MLKRILIAALLWPLLAFGQSYPSPTFNNITSQGTATLNNATVSGTFTATGKIGLASLAAQAANTVVGNATGSSASPTAITVTGCNGAAQALQWTNGSGFGCNSGIATSGANANITSLSALSTALSVAQGGTGAATLTANGVLFGNGTSAVSATSVGTSGQVLTSNGAGVAPTFQVSAGRLLNVQRFTSSGTYTPTSGTGSVIIEIQGGGGAGGGAPATGAAQCSTGAGGAAGGYIKHRMTSGFSGATVTVGAAGTAGSGVAGGAGGSSSFAGITAGGGTGGPVTAAAAAANSIGTAGGTATGGSILNVPGQPGNSSIFQASNNLGFPGHGAASVFGSGGSGAVNGTGGAANGFGSGGGGTLDSSSVAAQTGGAGSAGIVIVWEYQ
jgi:hypothetical protein